MTKIPARPIKVLGGDTVLSRVPRQIVEALHKAEEARKRAIAARDHDTRTEWFEMEQRWLMLVESLRFVEQADRFITDAAAQKKKSKDPK